jgi:penicillin-binding protein 2
MTGRQLAFRKHTIIFIILTVAAVFLIRLFYLQLIDQNLKLSSQNNVLRFVTQYPARGTIFDRNGALLVYNEAAYDLLVIPRQVKLADTLAFCGLLKIDIESFRARLNKARKHSRFRPSVFLEQISKEDYGIIVEKLYQYPGFFFQARTLRKYPMPIAAHVLGDVGEVNNNDIQRDPHYRMGDYIGKSGIERYYETHLRGRKGMKVMMVDVHNREKGSYQDGKFDTLPVSGEHLTLGLDARLQAYGEQLMANKTGSIVAIDPKTGEILVLVTSPAYDPNLLVGRVRGTNFNQLLNDPNKPLINRAISGTYPPGSTFKMINALVALQSGAITEHTQFSCQGKGSTPIRCTHDHQSPLAVKTAIEHSCNPFFWNTFRSTLYNSRFKNQKEAYEYWYEKMLAFGLGHRFDTDIPFELSGNIPSRNYFDRVYRGSWNALTVRSLSIGQGEILLTPLQLANLAAVIGNEGHYFPPHLVRKIGDDKANVPEKFTQQIETGIDRKYYKLVKEAMLDVFEGGGGTARRFKSEAFKAAGKTGTVQNPHGKDHSMFLAFAPFDDPRIAIAVVVENAGFGSTWAAPIASLLMEQYLTGEVKRKELEQRMFDGTTNF